MSENKDFFNRVKSWCKENRTTIKALMAGCSGGEWTEAVYFGWRSGDSLPKGENIARLARFMGVSCDWLITGEEENGLTEREEGLLRLYNRLDDSGKIRAEAYMQGLLDRQGVAEAEIAFEKRRLASGA